MYVFLIYLTFLLDQFDGGFLFYFWLVIAGPKWTWKIITEQASVSNL